MVILKFVLSWVRLITMVMGQLKILIRQYNFTRKLVMAKRCLDATT